jgi:hypothetical protein
LKLTTLALFLAAPILAGCQNASSLPTTAELPRHVGLARGIDLPTDASDVLNELKGSQLDFVARYYRDPASRWPTLTASEVRRLSSLGFKIVTVWEWHSGDPGYFSYASGYSDALSAYRQAKGVAQPPGSAIYFAVDFNANVLELPQVDQYFRGIAAGFATAGNGRPEYKVGVYGSGAVCDALKRAGLAQYAWLSNSRAWAGASSYIGWNIRQSGQFANLSFSHDSNEAKDDYGGFQPTNYVSDVPSAAAVAPEAAAPQAPTQAQSFPSMIRSWF